MSHLGDFANNRPRINEDSVVRMFYAMAERIAADEPWKDVIADYGLMVVPSHSVWEPN